MKENPTKVDVWSHLNGQGEENTWMSGPTGRKIHTLSDICIIPIKLYIFVTFLSNTKHSEQYTVYGALECWYTGNKPFIIVCITKKLCFPIKLFYLSIN